jgi:hypothetical protein
MEERKNDWDSDLLRELHTLPLETARKAVIDLVQSGTTRPSKKAHLIRDFMKCKTSAEISRIMYNALLAGSGLGIQGSAWSKLHGASQ